MVIVSPSATETTRPETKLVFVTVLPRGSGGGVSAACVFCRKVVAATNDGRSEAQRPESRLSSEVTAACRWFVQCTNQPEAKARASTFAGRYPPNEVSREAGGYAGCGFAAHYKPTAARTFSITGAAAARAFLAPSRKMSSSASGSFSSSSRRALNGSNILLYAARSAFFAWP